MTHFNLNFNYLLGNCKMCVSTQIRKKYWRNPVKNKLMMSAALLISSVISAQAMAGEVIVTPTSGEWTNRPDELRNGATAAITATAPRNGNGSLELTGDRTRFAAGNIYPSAASVSLADLSTVTGLTFDWRIAAGSTTNYNVDYTPALRLHIFDTGANVRKELIWEGAYNNTYGNTARDTWYTSSVLDKFYITGGSENAGMTIAQWASTLDTGSFVSGISVGSGGGAGLGYNVFADNVTFSTTSGSTTFNFETAAIAGAVPEPSTWAFMLFGFGAVGVAMRKRKGGQRAFGTLKAA